MLVFDSAYTWRILNERNIAALVTGRDLDGYFEHIWTCHPVASLLEAEDSPLRYGPPQVHRLGPRHTFVEGAIGRYRWLAWFPLLNYLVAQLGLFAMLLRLIGRKRIAVVRAEDPLYNGLFAWALSRLKGLPLLIGVWGNPGAVRLQTGRPLMPRLFRSVAAEERVERFVLKHADLVMIQNEDNRRYVENVGVPHERTALFRLSNLLHEDHFTDPADRATGGSEIDELVAGCPTMLCISRLQDLKLVDHAVMAVATLKERGLPVTLLLVGDGPFRDDLEKLALQLKVTDQVRFCGDRDQVWLSRIIPRVSVVVSPLTGRALAEAALGGAPVVAYDIDWHSELIETGKTGELAPYLDHSALADGAEKLIRDPDYAREMGANLRRRALEMLDPKTADRVQIDAYANAVARHGRR